MKRTQVVLFAALLLLAALVTWLALRNPEPPQMPADEDHAGPVDAEDCLVCHGPDGGYPKSDTHPIGRRCSNCHGMERQG